jgi:hypothetical protein
MIKRITVKIDEKGYPEIEKMTGSIQPYELLHAMVMAAMMRFYDGTDMMPEEVLTDVNRIGLQFVDVINEELYGGEDDDEDEELTEEQQAEIESAMKMIIDKHMGETNDGASPNSNNPQLN